MALAKKIRLTFLLSLICFCNCQNVPDFTNGTLYSDPIANATTYLNNLGSCSIRVMESLCGTSGYDCGDLYTFTDASDQCTYVSAIDPCVSTRPNNYNQHLHVAAIFIILFASLVGAGIPLLTKCVSWFKVDPFHICLGKCAGVGVILSCGLVHMLQPASESLRSTCLGNNFTRYSAWAFATCIVAILFMHFVEFAAGRYLENTLNRACSGHEHVHHHHHTHGAAQEATPTISNVEMEADTKAVKNASPGLDSPHPHYVCGVQTPDCCTEVKIASLVQRDAITPLNTQERMSKSPTSKLFDEHAGHAHSLLLVQGTQRTLKAYLLEFGVTVHSIFIGLQNGIVGEDELKTLLIALSFHQCFEGVALGSRIVDANLPAVWHDWCLALLFSIAAPVGIACGIGITATVNPTGATFLYIQGFFDAFCAGILIYLGVSMLCHDFAEDCKRFVTKHSEEHRMYLMFLFLWGGAGIMSFIGLYL